MIFAQNRYYMGGDKNMELNYAGIGQRIARRRIQIGLKQLELADRLDISNNYLSSIERGKENPSLEVIVSLCNELRVTPDYLLMGNMYSNNIPQNIVDGLRICSEADSIIPRPPHQEQQAPHPGPAVTQDMYLHRHRSLESDNPLGCRVSRA